MSGFPPLLRIQVSPVDDGQRLDRFLKKNVPQVPFIGLQKMLRQGKIRVNGNKAKGESRLSAGDILTLPPPTAAAPTDTSHSAYQVQEADFAMLETATVYEDGALLVLNKPAGLPAQAGGGQVRSLDRILAGAYGAEKAPKLTHRLDKETTGLIVCAKNRTMAAAMAALFAEKTEAARTGKGHAPVTKTYLACVVGALPGPAGHVRAPIAKVGPFAKVSPQGDPAHTTWAHLRTFTQGGVTFHLLACTPHTGRMNQIRVHMAHIGLPLVGDDKYGSDALKQAGKALHPKGAIPLYLHAWKLAFPHPQSHIPLTLQAPLPPHFAAVMGTASALPA